MKINTNRWNKLRYTFYTPGYDLIAGIFKSSRQRSIAALDIHSGDNVLIVGAGTGLDLEFMPANCTIVATDLTPSMIQRTTERNHMLKLNVETKVMDGQNLTLPNNSFDKIILHLILAVIPDPVACLREAERVLKPGGRIAVFDKFVPKNRTVSIVRKIFNPIATFLFSDITRSFETIVSNSELKILNDTPADFGGNFRILLLEKPEQ